MFLVTAMTAALVAACSSNSGEGGGNDTDASSDATGPEAGMDATSPDATPEDGSSEAGDAGSDAVADGSDLDAPRDSSPEPDAAHEAGPLDAGTDASTDGPSGDAPASDAPSGEDGQATDASDAGPSCPGCVVLATATNPVGMAADANNVYWLDDAANGTVKKVPIAGLGDGGAPVNLASNQDFGSYSESSYSGIAVDATYVYWATLNFVMKAPIDGSSAPQIIAGGQPNAVVVDSSNLYWTSANTLDPPYGGVFMVPKDADASAVPTTLVANAGNVGGLAVAGGTAYYAVWPTGVFSVPIAGAGMPPTTIESGFGAPAGIAIGSAQVFWTGSFVGSAGLFAAPLGGLPDGGAPEVISSVGAQPNVVADASNVYWIAGGQILEAPLAGLPDGGAPKVLATNQGTAIVLTVDPLAQGNVYWAASAPSGSGWVIVAVPK